MISRLLDDIRTIVDYLEDEEDRGNIAKALGELDDLEEVAHRIRVELEKEDTEEDTENDSKR